MKKYLAELDAIYEADPCGQGTRAAGIVGDVSQLMATTGHPDLLRAPVDDADVIEVKRISRLVLLRRRRQQPC